MTGKEIYNHEWEIGERVFMIGYISSRYGLPRKPMCILEFEVYNIDFYNKGISINLISTPKSEELIKNLKIINCKPGNYFLESEKWWNYQAGKEKYYGGNTDVFLGDIQAEKQLKQKIESYNEAVIKVFEQKLERLNIKEEELKGELKRIKIEKKFFSNYSKFLIK